MADIDLQSLGMRLGEAITPTPSNAPQVRYGTIAMVNSDGTLDVTIDGTTLRGVCATTGCVGAAEGMRCVVLRQGPLATVVGLIASTDLGDVTLPDGDVNASGDVNATLGMRATWLSINNNTATIASTGDATVNNLTVNGTTTHSNQVKFASETALPNASTSTDFFAVGINAFANGGRLAYKNLAAMKTWLGHEDTDWAYLVGNASAANYVRYRKKAGIVFVEVYYASGAGLTTSNKLLGTLPAGFRPSKQIVIVPNTNANNLSKLWVNAGGTIYAATLSGSAAVLQGAVSFPV